MFGLKNCNYNTYKNRQKLNSKPSTIKGGNHTPNKKTGEKKLRIIIGF